jgi:hypothetical protein
MGNPAYIPFYINTMDTGHLTCSLIRFELTPAHPWYSRATKQSFQRRLLEMEISLTDGYLYIWPISKKGYYDDAQSTQGIVDSPSSKMISFPHRILHQASYRTQQ